MHIVVMGAGGVGGYFGGRLAKNGAHVTFLVRSSRATQLRKRGLRVQSTYGDFSLQPQICIDPEEIHAPDVVLVSLKNYHLIQAMPTLRILVEAGAKVLPLLNGIEHLQMLINEFGYDHVLGGSCYIEVTLNADGDIVHTSKVHDMVYGPLPRANMDKGWLSRLEQSLRCGEFPVRPSQDIIFDMWQKYLFLSTFSGMTSAVRQPIGPILKDSRSADFLLRLAQEICTIAIAEGVNIPQDMPQILLRRLQGIEPEMTSSMHRDLQKGLPLELDSLQGGLLRIAHAKQISVPCLQAIYDLLHPYAEGGLKAQEQL